MNLSVRGAKLLGDTVPEIICGCGQTACFETYLSYSALNVSMLRLLVENIQQSKSLNNINKVISKQNSMSTVIYHCLQCLWGKSSPFSTLI